MRCNRMIFLATLLALLVPSLAFAEGSTEKTSTEEGKEADEAKPPFHRTFGFGAEVGYWFSDLNAFGTYVFDNNRKGGESSPHQNFRRGGDSSHKEKLGSNISGNWNLDLALETQLFEGIRLGIFGGVQSPVVSTPSSWAYYGGLEPAFAYRKQAWEFALGMGVGFGGVTMKMQDEYKDKLNSSKTDFSANFVMLRPFFEGRYYFNHWFGLYGRIGFNQWLIQSIAGGLQPKEALGGRKLEDRSKLDNLNEGQLYISVGVRFGWYGAPKPEPKLTNPVDDRDGDGYKDNVDKCPDDPEDFDGFQDEDGCPDPDNDKDGITDKLDKCPNDPEDFDGIDDEDGCPEYDYDKDGIADVDDKCPKVFGIPERQGCAPEEVEIAENEIKVKEPVHFNEVNFAFDQTTLLPAAYNTLNSVAEVINGVPGIRKVEVAGHTDHHGTEQYNLALSQKRADVVREYLVNHGVQSTRLTAVGYGFSRPIVPLPPDGKETEEAAAKNRRVEFIILEQDPEKGPTPDKKAKSAVLEPSRDMTSRDIAPPPMEASSIDVPSAETNPPKVELKKEMPLKSPKLK